jgi:predicted dinucleotide-binding enzyme
LNHLDPYPELTNESPSMKIAVLGTGIVGETIASKLVALGHEVRLGSRTPANEKAVAWAARAGKGASHGTFGDAAGFGEIVFNCTLGSAALDVLHAAGRDRLAGKILIDVTNPLEFKRGQPPTLFVSNDDSLGERIQRAFPEVRVVKALSTVNCQVMVEPGRVPGDHAAFVCGNDAAAKEEVSKILRSFFGWTQVVDLGDITASRATESYVLLWVRLRLVLGTSDFNVALVKP